MTVVVGMFLLAFAFYLHGAAPTVTTGDSGEFITAARTLAIPHPPAFPSYTLTAHVFSELLPWGNAAYRVNLFSSACAALCAALLVAFLIEQGLALPYALLAGGLILQAPQMITIASTTEVFALHLALSLGVLVTASHRPHVSLFLLGLGFANHQTILLLAPVVLLLQSNFFSGCHPRGRSRGSKDLDNVDGPPTTQFGGDSKWRLLFMYLGAFALGASAYLMLPLRAMQQPLMNWDNPQTLDRFWRLITRADYGSLTLALGETPARTMANTLLQLKRFVGGLSSEVTWVGILAGVVGLASACVRDRKAWAWGLAFVLVGPFFFVLGNLPFDAQSNGLLGRFYTLPLFLWVLFIVYGFQALAKASRLLPWVVFGLPLLFFLYQRPAEAFPWRAEFSAYAYGRNNLKTLPMGSTFIMDGGRRYVLHARLSHAGRRAAA